MLSYTMCNFLERFKSWDEFDNYMRSHKKNELYHDLLSSTNYDYPHSVRSVTKRDIVNYFSMCYEQLLNFKE